MNLRAILKEALLDVYRDRWLYDKIVAAIRRRQAAQWRKEGRPLPKVPHWVKEQVVLEYARNYGLTALVETGTFVGNMVSACRNHFGRIWSIELDESLYARAARRFARFPHISIHRGDSATALPMILRTLDVPALFWLDAHYSGGQTARGELDTPIRAEVIHICQHTVQGHMILIDDAHEFLGTNGYPTLGELGDLVHRLSPARTINVVDNIVRIHSGPSE